MTEPRITDGREFIRHPSNIPLKASVDGKSQTEDSELQNISDAGLAFYSAEHYDVGSIVTISFPSLERAGDVGGEVIWSNKADDGTDRYVVGIHFPDDDAYRHARTVEQICHIESYRQMQEHLRGEKMSSREAAEEWIEKFAKDFPK